MKQMLQQKQAQAGPEQARGRHRQQRLVQGRRSIPAAVNSAAVGDDLPFSMQLKHSATAIHPGVKLPAAQTQHSLAALEQWKQPCQAVERGGYWQQQQQQQRQISCAPQPQRRFQKHSNCALAAAANSQTAAATFSADGGATSGTSADAICLRTRSKYPLAAQAFDPDEFDRVLAECDPDVEPLVDDEMYQQFLQVMCHGPGQQLSHGCRISHVYQLHCLGLKH
jgi:hypothetical protein